MTTASVDFPAIVLSNNKLKITVLTTGASLVGVALNDDPAALNPLWVHPFDKTPGFGHFVCVDGFGPVSPQEQRAGLPMHGEAHRQIYQVREHTSSTLTLTSKLPLVQEEFTRTYQIVDGENIVYVSSELENLLAFDRPVHWAEHATIGEPFLKRGETVVDMSGARAKTRAWHAEAQPPHRLASSQDFAWPLAPGLDGGLIDLRAAGPGPSGDHTTCLMDPARPLSWMTFLDPGRRLLLGYIFHRDEFPWVQNWEYYPAQGHLARGLEFSTMPFDVPRREAIQTNTLFDTPTYRWLPARSKITTNFLLFWVRTPAGFTKIEDVRLANGAITVCDASKTTVELNCAWRAEQPATRGRNLVQ